MSMHTYSSDHSERIRVTLIIGALSILAAWLLHLLIALLQWEIPWWFETPSVLGIFALFRALFDKSLWRLTFLRKLLGLSVPDLNGKWRGQLISSYTNHTTPMDVDVLISQTWTTIVILLETTTSVSKSRAAAFVAEQPGRISIWYEYLSEPKPAAVATMHTHRGTGELIVSSDGNSLDGEYYTGRDRETYGSLNLKRVSHNLSR